MKQDVQTYPVVILGAGPAGLSAAMQLSRQRIEHLVLERNRLGGLLWNANLVENYPGFVEGISGPALVGLFEDQAKRLGLNIVYEEGRITGFSDEYLRIDTKNRRVRARVVIAASGTIAKKLPPDLLGTALEGRVFSDVYPLTQSAGNKILILGGGDAAFDFALNLAEKNQVQVLVRGAEIKALPLLVERSRYHPDITCMIQTELQGIALGPDGRLQVSVIQDGHQEMLEGDYLIAAIGRQPDLSFADTSIINEIQTLQDEGRLYLIGDLKNGLFRQTAIAAGDGIQAAMEVGQNLSKEII